MTLNEILEMLSNAIVANKEEEKNCNELAKSAAKLIKQGEEYDKKHTVMLIKYAAYAGDIELMKIFLDDGVDIIHADEWSYTIHVAASAEKDNSEMVQFLLDNGVDINHATEDNQTAIYIAAKKGVIANIQVLLKNGATINIKNNDGIEPTDLDNFIKNFLNNKNLINSKDNLEYQSIYLADFYNKLEIIRPRKWH